MELEGSSKAIKTNLMLKTGIQIKADQTDGSPIFSCVPPTMEHCFTVDWWTITSMLAVVDGSCSKTHEEEIRSGRCYPFLSLCLMAALVLSMKMTPCKPIWKKLCFIV